MNANAASLERLSYSVEEAIAVTGLGRTYLYELMNTGELSSIKLGRRRLIAATALRDLLQRHETVA